jgi:hypothetical protein
MCFLFVQESYAKTKPEMIIAKNKKSGNVIFVVMIKRVAICCRAMGDVTQIYKFALLINLRCQLGGGFAALQIIQECANCDTQARTNGNARGNITDCGTDSGADCCTQDSNHSHFACSGAE